MSAQPFLFALSCAALLGAAGCPGGPVDEKRACHTVIDCNLDEACRDGECGPNTPVEGEGEGDPSDEAEAIAAVCQKIAVCHSDPTSAQTCIVDATNQFAQMRASSDPDCPQAAADLGQLYICAAGATCDELNNEQGQLAVVCPIFNQLENEIGLCEVFTGEGEGEGEGEICTVLGQDPNPSTDLVQIGSVTAKFDAVPLDLCGTPTSASLVLDVRGDTSLVAQGVSSFLGFGAFEITNLGVSEGVVTGTACTDSDFDTRDIAVQLFLSDGTQTNAVCGFVEGP